MLRTLLAPLTPEAFISEYWAKRPLYLKGDPGRFAGLLDIASFERAVCNSGPIPVGALRASFDKKTANGRSAPAPGPTSPISTVTLVDADRAFALFADGATLCMSHMESRVPKLLPILAAVKRELGYPGGVGFSAYLSPPHTGYNWHFDARIACTLQIAGKKRWRYSSRAVTPWPQSNGTLFGDGTVRFAVGTEYTRANTGLAAPDEADVTEALLEPGDLLMLPAGVWHEACSEDGISLALNLSFSRFSNGLLVQQLLDSLLSADPEWRSASPLLAAGKPGAIASASSAALTAQLQRAAAVLNALRADSVEVVHLWESLVQNFGVPRGSMISNENPPVVPEQRLRVRDDGDFYAMLADGGSRLCVLVGGNGELEFNGPSIPFIQRLLREREFIAGDCMQWSSAEPFAWTHVEVLLTELQRQGLIVAVR